MNPVMIFKLYNRWLLYLAKYRSRLCHWGSLHRLPNRTTSPDKIFNSSLLNIHQKPSSFFSSRGDQCVN